MLDWLFSLLPSTTVSALALQLAAGNTPSVLAAEAFQAPLPSRETRLSGPGTRIANLSPAACKARLKALDVTRAVVPAAPTSGVATAVRIVGPLGDLELRVPAPKFSYGTLDCRLAVLLLELAPELTRAGVVSLTIDGFYRKNARLGGKKGKKSQHAYGLAIDLVTLQVKDEDSGSRLELNVARDFFGLQGEDPCGPEARLHPPDTATSADIRRGILLRNFVCRVAAGGWFHHVLTPNHDRAHESHLHLDIKRDSRWLSLD